MSDVAAVLLTTDDGSGETFELSDPGELNQRSMILTDPATGNLHLVDREQFMGGGYSVTIDCQRQTTGKPQRRRFGRKGKR